ncbi:MAG TPA: TAXI family TRAP transporter solute-binding subunit [Methylovirgula sp.]|nr:TAXI family TRAP transporter solute-binding subunit [Methylovirgula sp.]
MRIVLASFLSLFLVAFISGAGAAGGNAGRHAWQRHQAIDSQQAISDYDRERQRINDNVVTILSGNRDGDSLGIVYDLSEVLDDGDNLRVLPVVGKGSAQNVRDILLLHGIDMGITHSNILNHYAKTGELGDIKSQIAYISKLFNEEMHILAGPGVKDLNDLRGKPVNFGETGSGTELTSQLVFQALGINVKEVNMGQADAVAAIKDGRIAATILITGKPSSFVATLKPSDGLKLVPIPFTAPLFNDYYPAVLEHADYPNLIPEGQRVDTVANCAVLAAFNWPKYTDRYNKVAKFVDAFFNHFEDFRKPPRRAKWREVNFAATLEGWTRFPAAQAWIDASRPQEATQQDFDRFLATSGKDQGLQSDAQREELFRAFVKWKASQAQH